jgi:hypothetical protein
VWRADFLEQAAHGRRLTSRAQPFTGCDGTARHGTDACMLRSSCAGLVQGGRFNREAVKLPKLRWLLRRRKLAPGRSDRGRCPGLLHLLVLSGLLCLATLLIRLPLCRDRFSLLASNQLSRSRRLGCFPLGCSFLLPQPAATSRAEHVASGSSPPWPSAQRAPA